MNLRCSLILFIISLLFIQCSSEPKKTDPEWIHQPTRLVDNGYIVYVGVATAPSADRAKFKAEGLALEDLANECSLIPKGARVEDRYVQKEKYETTAYVKLALEFQECEEAKRTLEPEGIRKIANVGFTEELKKYQDLMETGEMPASGQVAQIEPPAEVPPPPARQVGWSDSTQFYVTRQYVAYQKEVVVLAPPTTYVANSPSSRSFVERLQPVSEQIQTQEKATPALRTQSWSSVPNRMEAFPRPATLAPPARAARAQSLNAPPRPPAYHRQEQPNPPRKRRRHSNYH